MSDQNAGDRDEVLREPGEGESYDANGNIRPVPGGVPDQPEGDRDEEKLVTDGGEDLPEPEEMELEELREQYRDLAGLGPSEPWEQERKMNLWYELCDRVDVEQPECPECGEGNWGQAPGEPVRCNSCDHMLGRDPELRQEIQNAWNEIMYGDDSEKELVTDGGEHTCESCGESSWTEENGQFGGIVCAECGYRPKKAIRDEIRESGEALATDGGADAKDATGELHAATETAQLNNAADRLRGLDLELDEWSTDDLREQLREVRSAVVDATPEAEWNIGVEELEDSEQWDWFTVYESTEQAAHDAATTKAEENGYENPCVYETSGPFPKDA